MTDARALIKALDLAPHPEGGWYRETWRAEAAPGQRASATAILFLLEAGQRSHWHKVDATELWLFHAGSALALRTSASDAGPARTDRLGSDILAGDQPQLRVPTGHWQSAEADRGWALVSCVVSPGFEFPGFVLAPREWSPGGGRSMTRGPPDDASVTAERGPFVGRPGHLDAPFWQTPLPLVERMLDLAKVGPGDRLIDLGCGDGRIVIAAARRGAEACGVDIDPDRITEAKAAARIAGAEDRVHFLEGDMFATVLGGYSVVTLYLLGHVNRWLSGKLRRELAPGARVAGIDFPMPDWEPAATDTIENRPVYVWIR